MIWTSRGTRYRLDDLGVITPGTCLYHGCDNPASRGDECQACHDALAAHWAQAKLDDARQVIDYGPLLNDFDQGYSS